MLEWHFVGGKCDLINAEGAFFAVYRNNERVFHVSSCLFLLGYDLLSRPAGDNSPFYSYVPTTSSPERVFP